MWAIRVVLFNILFYGLTVLMVSMGLVLLLLPQPVVMVYARLWAKGLVFLLRIVGISHRISGSRPTEQVIYAAKHQSAWETIVLYDELGSPAPVLKRELVFLPLIGFYFLRMPSVPINRGAGARALKLLIKHAQDIAGVGHSILIFPQGTRVAPGAEHPYHIGTFSIYKATGLPVVPVALNSGLFWPRASFSKRAGVIDVHLGEPIPPGLERKAFMERLEGDIENTTSALPGMAAGDKKG